jgi:hypothetical protein
VVTLRISFIPHALEQMRDRRIPRQEAEKTILAPDRVTTQLNGRTRAVRRVIYRGKPYVLVVAYDRQDGMIEVVTAFRSSKVEKYL